ncbi:MAG: lactonase family protein, partial [Rhodobacteraceae bacterium]|nr:lactonase family protein [Paracoccaceae bacterium]
MIHFNIAGTVVDDLTTDLRGLSDIKIVHISGKFVLVVASEADSAITSFLLSDSGVPVLVDSQAFNSNSGTGRISALSFAQVSGDTVLLPATRYEDQTAFFTLGDNGSLSGPSSDGESGISGEGIGLNETVVIGANTYVFVQSYGGQTLTAYVLGNNQRLSKLQELNDNDASFLGDISALSHWRIGTNSFLFVASAFDAGLSVYRIGNDGHLTLQDTVEPEDGSGFAKAQDLTSFEVEGRAFVVMASAGSSSLTVYRVADNGNLSEVDHLIDTLDTRFQNASLVEAFSFEGRQFLVAAGSDDGITVLEVLAGGVLRVEASLADTYGITLDNVSGVAVEIFGGVPVLYVSSSTDHGFTRIELDIVPPPQIIKGTPLADNLVGTDGDDRIEGR